MGGKCEGEVQDKKVGKKMEKKTKGKSFSHSRS